jgi:hypothetical protein
MGLLLQLRQLLHRHLPVHPLCTSTPIPFIPPSARITPENVTAAPISGFFIFLTISSIEKFPFVIVVLASTYRRKKSNLIVIFEFRLKLNIFMVQ